MEIYLVDGTYELFRHYFAVPSASDASGNEIAAVRGVLRSVVSMLERGATHVGVATDHIIESFRNELYPHYKTGAGISEDLMSQFVLLEEALDSLGVVVWPMEEFEADDALASAASKAAADERVVRILICTPDKDLSQCVVGSRVVQLDRRREKIFDAAAVLEKFGVEPASIPDYLALVGDTADGYPGLPGWGAKATASVLRLYCQLENIPRDPRSWHPSIRGAQRLAGKLFEHWGEALLFRRLATLRTDAPVFNNVDELRWQGPKADFGQLCTRLKATDLVRRVELTSQR